MEEKKKNGWLKRVITKLDCLMFGGNTPEYKPMLHSIMALGIYIGIGFAIAVYILSACGVTELTLGIIAGVIALGAVTYTIFKILPNIKMFESITKKILYIIVTLLGLMISFIIGAYLLILALICLVLYFVFTMLFGGGGTTTLGGKDALGRVHVATLKETGVKIYKGSDMMFNTYYVGSDGNYYEPEGSGWCMK